jgi:hypothetical protein
MGIRGGNPDRPRQRRGHGIREDLFDKAADVSWLILTFYVPALWVSVVLVAWRLWMGRNERVASS